MIDPTRAELLRELERLSEAAPDVRLGQLVANLSFLALGPAVESVWDVEDDKLLAAARQHLANLADRPARVA